MRYYKSFILFSLLALVFVACDTDDLEKDIDALKDRVASVEAQVQRLNVRQRFTSCSSQPK